VPVGTKESRSGQANGTIHSTLLSVCDNDKWMVRDPSLDALLDLHGQVLVIDPETRHWVRFVVHRIPVSEAKPHGLDYSLTMHGPSGERLVGFDNAHPVPGRTGPGATMPAAHDHKHRLKTVRPYEYSDAATLLADFWNEVDAMLREKGVIP
jgi:Family of unknown function (DUF6516)